MMEAETTAVVRFYPSRLTDDDLSWLGRVSRVPDCHDVAPRFASWLEGWYLREFARRVRVEHDERHAPPEADFPAIETGEWLPMDVARACQAAGALACCSTAGPRVRALMLAILDALEGEIETRPEAAGLGAVLAAARRKVADHIEGDSSPHPPGAG